MLIEAPPIIRFNVSLTQVIWMASFSAAATAVITFTRSLPWHAPNWYSLWHTDTPHQWYILHLTYCMLHYIDMQYCDFVWFCMIMYDYVCLQDFVWTCPIGFVERTKYNKRYLLPDVTAPSSQITPMSILVMVMADRIWEHSHTGPLGQSINRARSTQINTGLETLLLQFQLQNCLTQSPVPCTRIRESKIDQTLPWSESRGMHTAKPVPRTALGQWNRWPWALPSWGFSLSASHVWECLRYSRHKAIPRCFLSVFCYCLLKRESMVAQI